MTKEEQLKELYNTQNNNPKSVLIVDNNKRFVFGEGPAEANIMIVGEAPGREEDIQLRPFVGRAGQLLDKALNLCGIDRSQTYITNIIKARPTNNRTPTFDEIIRCWPVLQNQIDIIRPSIIITLGACAITAFTKKPVSITKQHGYAIPFENSMVIPTFHPAFILRNASFHQPFVNDIKFAIDLLENIKK